MTKEKKISAHDATTYVFSTKTVKKTTQNRITSKHRLALIFF